MKILTHVFTGILCATVGILVYSAMRPSSVAVSPQTTQVAARIAVAEAPQLAESASARAKQAPHATGTWAVESVPPLAVDDTSHDAGHDGDVYYPVASYTTTHASHDLWGVPRIIAALFLAAFSVLVAFGGFVILLRLTRARHSSVPEDSSAVQALHRMGCNLEARLESLETILIERSQRGHS